MTWRPAIRPTLRPAPRSWYEARRRSAFSWDRIFDGTPGFRVNVEEALRLNKAAIGSKTSGFTPEELAACVAFQDSAGTLPVTAMEQPLGYIKDLSGNGNHFVQPSNTPSRSIVSRRVNLLPTSEDFADAVWTKQGVTISQNSAVAPDGAQTADLIVESTGNENHRVYNENFIASTTVGAGYTLSVFVKAAGRSFAYFQLVNTGAPALNNGCLYDLTTLTAFPQVNVQGSISDAGNGWRRLTISCVSPTAGPLGVRIGPSLGAGPVYQGDGTSGIYVWGADLRLSVDNNLPYQRVTSPTDYDESGFPAYALFDGLDDWLETGVVDMTSTDEVTVIAASETTNPTMAGSVGVLLEFSHNVSANPGSFSMTSPLYLHTNGFRSRGSIAVEIGGAAVSRSVATGIGRISTDTVILRVNGVQAASSSADQGTGNYGAHKFYMGRRGGAYLPFKGRIYGVTVIGKLLTDSQLAAAERAERNLGRLY